MSPTLFRRRRAERFAQLLDEAGGGRRHHVRSRLDADLADLVTVGRQAGAIRPAVEIDPEFRADLRALLVATAEREGIGRTAVDPDQPEAAGRRSPASAASRRRRARGAIVIGVTAGAIAVSGMSAASEDAVPGDALYGVKRSTERAQLALAGSDIARGRLYLDFAHTRVAEAAAVPQDAAGFDAVLDDMDTDTRQGVKLLTTSAVQRRDPAALDAVPTFVTVQRLDLGSLLDQVSTPNRARTVRSLELLDAVTERAEALRTSLSCGDAATDGIDELGPRPQQCTGTGVPEGTSRSHPVRERPSGPSPAEHRRSGSPDTATAPTDSSSDTPVPDSPPAEAGPRPARPTPDSDHPTKEPSDAGTSGPDDSVMVEVGRVLDGLFG